MTDIGRTAPDKPVFVMELGFPDGASTDSALAAQKVAAGLAAILDGHPEIAGFALWTSANEGFPFDSLVRPGTRQGEAFPAIVDDDPWAFHSCVYLSVGSPMDGCDPDRG